MKIILAKNYVSPDGLIFFQTDANPPDGYVKITSSPSRPGQKYNFNTKRWNVTAETTKMEAQAALVETEIEALYMLEAMLDKLIEKSILKVTDLSVDLRKIYNSRKTNRNKI